MRILIGLIIVVTLALVASGRQWWSLRRTPIGAALTTGGWIAVAIGLLLGPSLFRVIQTDQVKVLQPLVLFCLGWVGLMVGLQAHRQLPRMLPAAATRLAGVDTLVSLLVLGGAALGTLWLVDRELPLIQGIVIALLLGACGIGWAPELRSLRELGTADRGLRALLRGASGVGSILAVFCYGLLFASLRHEPAFALSGMNLGIGVAMSIVMAVVLGLMTWWLIRAAKRSDAEFLVVLLGMVSFMAGGAAVMGYSPLFVSLFCGAVLANVPGDALTRFRRVIIDAEQPMAMALMLVAGVLADPAIGQAGLALVIVLVAVRAAAKRLLTAGAVRRASGPVQPDSPMRRAPIRQGPLAIALAAGYAVSAHEEMTSDLLTGGQILMVVIFVGVICDAIPWISRAAWRGESRPAAGQAEARSS